MTKPAGTGMNKNCNLTFKKIVSPGFLAIVDFFNCLDLNEMIPGPECPELIFASFHGSFT